MLPTMPPAIRCSKSANNGVAAVSRRFERCSHVSFGRPDWLAGHVGLELRNVGKNYPFERSRRFPGIQPNSSHRDHSLLSCVAGDTQLGPGSCPEFKRRAAITAKAVERLALSPARA